jgi:hypothetical protein
MGARFYNPTIGRFITRDTYEGDIYQPWTQNLYTYCNNNPVNFVDPTGHDWIKALSDWGTSFGQGINSWVEPNISGPLNQIASGDLTPVENTCQFLDDAGTALMISDPIPNYLPVPVLYLDNAAGGAVKGVGKTGKAFVKGAGNVGKFSKYSPEQIEKTYGLKKGQFHRGVKGDILSDLTGKN